MKKIGYVFVLCLIVLSVDILWSLDNGNRFRVAWQDDEANITAGWTITRHSFDFDRDGKGEFCAYDMVSGEKLGFIFEATGNDAYSMVNVMPMGGGSLALTDWNQNGLNEILILDEAMLLFESSGSDDGYPFDATVMWTDIPKKGFFGGTSQGAPAVFDADGDGDLEVICNYARQAYHIPMYASYFISIFSFNGDFSNPGGKIEFTSEFPIECCGFDWGDLDGDGRIDIVASVNQTEQLRVFTSDGKDAYRLKYEWKRAEGTLLGMSECYTPMVVDMDQDGKDEIYYCDTHGLLYIITVDLSQPITAENFHYVGKFQPVGPGRQINDMRSTNPGGSLGDQDGDGKPDLYWCDYNAEAVYDLEYESGSILDSTSYNWYRIWENTTTNPFGVTMLCLGDDMDRDNKREIAMIQRDTNLDPPAVMVLESLDEITAVPEIAHHIWESGYMLHQNYPNPFNSATTISYTLPRGGQTSLKIYDLLGREIQSIVNEYQARGIYEYQWNGTDHKGHSVPSHLYICILQSEESIFRIKMLLLK